MMPMMLCSALLFSLAIVWCPVETSSTTVLADSSIMAGGTRTSFDVCPASCGSLAFAYPFVGVGPDCSRAPDCSLICDDDASRPTSSSHVALATPVDYGYNQKESRANCTRHCGNIAVPFPFGLEDGCFGRKQFQLFCTNATSSGVLQFRSGAKEVIIINLQVNEAILNYTYQRMNAPGSNRLYGYGLTHGSMQWFIANLSCVEAKQNASGYACVSINSRCVEVNTSSISGYRYLGYRCKCTDGFKGNPYVESGCQDIDECLQQDICKGRVCSNIEGSFKCNACPRMTEYDPIKNQCKRTYQQHLFIIGFIIGLFGGISILLVMYGKT